MIVVSRFIVPEAGGAAFLARGQAALDAMADRPGYTGGRLGRAVDDPTHWVLVTEWDGVGSYRRALSSYEVKVNASPLLAESANEPSAYEVLVGDDGRHSSDRAGG